MTQSAAFMGGIRLSDDTLTKKDRLKIDDRDVRWWDGDSADRYLRVMNVVRRLMTWQQYRRAADIHWARMYSDTDYQSLTRQGYTPARFTPGRLTFNVTKNAIDTLCAKISKNQPLPMFLTSGGDFSSKRRARQLTKFAEAAFDASRVFETTPSVILDSCVYGTGFVQVYLSGKEIVVERVYPWEVIVDEGEGMYGEPRSIYKMRWMDKLELASMFPDDDTVAIIAHCPTSPIDQRQAVGRDVVSDQIAVVECWRLPSKKGGKDGRHSIVCLGGTLLDEAYDRDVFPLIPLRRQRPLVGYWGIGVAQEISGIQYEINVMAAKVQRSHHLMGGSIWLLPESAGIPTSVIDNGIGTVVRFKGQMAPQSVTTQPLHPQTYTHLMNLIPKAFEMSGISQLSATSQKPQGLNSGKAIQEYNNIETERFIIFGRAYEDFCIEIARHMIHWVRKLAAKDKDWALKIKKKTHLEIVKWNDVEVDEDDYIIQVFPTAMLARTPSARMQQVQDLAAAKWITPEQAKMLLDFPDLESVIGPESASYRATERAIESILVSGKYVPPVSAMNLQQTRQMAQLAWVEAWTDELSEDRLDMLQRYIDQCTELMTRGMQPDGTTPGQEGMSPQGPGAEMMVGPDGMPIDPNAPMPMGPDGMPMPMPPDMPQGMPPEGMPPGPSPLEQGMPPQM